MPPPGDRLDLAISRDIVSGIAKPSRSSPEPSRAAQLLLKAVRGLPEREQRVVLAYLVERAIAPPAAAEPQGVALAPATEPASGEGPRMPVPRAVVEGLGAVAAGMLYGDRPVGELAALYGVPEETVRDCLRELASEPDAPEPQASLLRLIADGRSPAQCRKELKLSRQELERMRERPQTRELERRLARALLTRSYHRDRAAAVLRVTQAAPPGFGPPAGAAAQFAGGPQRAVPVRFPEDQYDRLKDWCARHGFPMAVVVRGLVERFLDDQERRAA